MDEHNKHLVFHILLLLWYTPYWHGLILPTEDKLLIAKNRKPIRICQKSVQHLVCRKIIVVSFQILMAQPLTHGKIIVETDSVLLKYWD